MVTRDCGDREGTDCTKSHKVTFGGDKNILYFNVI